MTQRNNLRYLSNAKLPLVTYRNNLTIGFIMYKLTGEGMKALGFFFIFSLKQQKYSAYDRALFTKHFRLAYMLAYKAINNLLSLYARGTTICDLFRPLTSDV